MKKRLRKKKYRGLLIIQNLENNHICIYEKNKLVFHTQFNQKLKYKELKNMYEDYIALKELADIFKD